MSGQPVSTRSKILFAPDTWAVLVAIGLAAAVRFGLLKTVPW